MTEYWQSAGGALLPANSTLFIVDQAGFRTGIGALPFEIGK